MAKQIWKPGNMLNPLPVVMVTCQRPGEKPNIITVAWAGTICTNPPMLSVSIRPSRYSYEIIKESKELVVNLVTKDLAYACDLCGVLSGRDINKFEKTNLTPLKSQIVQTPGIAESLVNIECRVKDILDLGSHSMFICNVLSTTIEDDLLDEKNKFNLNSSCLVSYSHGEYRILSSAIGKFGFSVAKKKKRNKK